VYYIEETNEIKNDGNLIAEANNLREEISVLTQASIEYDQLMLEAENRKIQIEGIRKQMYKQLRYKQKMLLILENEYNQNQLKWKISKDSNNLVCANCGANKCDCGTDMVTPDQFRESKNLPTTCKKCNKSYYDCDCCVTGF